MRNKPGHRQVRGHAATKQTHGNRRVGVIWKMPGPHCAITECTNGFYGLQRWRKQICEVHNTRHDDDECVCAPPYDLFTFPSARSDEDWRKRWIKLGPTKHRTDRTDRTGGEIAAGKAQINCRDLVINLYTAYHPIHD